MAGTNRSGGDRVANGQDTFPRDGMPSRPLDLTKEEQELWTVLMSQIPNEFLRRVDSHQIKTLCELLAAKDRVAKAMKNDPEDMRIVRTYINVSQQLNRLSALYGLSPLDRRRMKIETEQSGDDEDEWSD